MKVYELIGYLEECEPEAEIKLMIQPNWPFEYAVDGIVRRSSFAASGENLNDVFLLQGTQLCYGSQRAWDANFYDECSEDDED